MLSIHPTLLQCISLHIPPPSLLTSQSLLAYPKRSIFPRAGVTSLILPHWTPLLLIKTLISHPTGRTGGKHHLFSTLSSSSVHRSRGRISFAELLSHCGLLAETSCSSV
ncbi:unnamed protein product [Leuciscus chuanchicus]